MNVCEPCTDEGIQAEEEDLDANPVEDLVNKYLDEGEGEIEEDQSNNHVIPDVAAPESKEKEQEADDKTPEPVEQVGTNLF